MSKALFSKRHYEVIADIIFNLDVVTTPQEISLLFASRFKEDNALFNKEEFLEACGENDLKD